jgi:tRNA-splicing ligase RtcB
MYETIYGDKGREIRSWLPSAEMEPQAMAQLMAAVGHPALGPYIAVMPDCHLGVGVTIGCILPTELAIIPNAVGVDIGCGMQHAQTSIPYDPALMGAAFWQEWARQVKRDVPMGFKSHSEDKGIGILRGRSLRATELQPLVDERAVYQVGTLGGGNHFIEAQVNDDGLIAFMLHSGSRHIGLRIANYYDQKAQEQVIKYKARVPRDLAHLSLETVEGQNYVHDMHWAMDYARLNRDRMMKKVLGAFWIALTAYSTQHIASCEPFICDVSHNYAEIDGDMAIHRKGATSARFGELGIIPGSMGTKSYKVLGKGNTESFESCSHGAGRTMSRGQAKREITLNDFRDSLAGTYSAPSLECIDEAPGAYKDIDRVIELQQDLLYVVNTFTPLMTVKGQTKAAE